MNRNDEPRAGLFRIHLESASSQPLLARQSCAAAIAKEPEGVRGLQAESWRIPCKRK